MSNLFDKSEEMTEIYKQKKAVFANALHNCHNYLLVKIEILLFFLSNSFFFLPWVTCLTSLTSTITYHSNLSHCSLLNLLPSSRDCFSSSYPNMYYERGVGVVIVYKPFIVMSNAKENQRLTFSNAWGIEFVMLKLYVLHYFQLQIYYQCFDTPIAIVLVFFKFW